MRRFKLTLVLVSMFLLILASFSTLADQHGKKEMGEYQRAGQKMQHRHEYGKKEMEAAEKPCSANTCGTQEGCKNKNCMGENCPYCSSKKKNINPQTMCPIMEGKIDKKYSAVHKGKKVYFCCADCVNEFKKNPDKYVKQIEDEGITLEKVVKPQTTCPIMGKSINKKYSAEHKGKRVNFCCAGCESKFKKNPEKYMKQLEKQGITLEKVVKPQKTCPVMGGNITSKHYADYQGKRVYFCCPGCSAKFKENPQQYLKKLEKLGEVPEEIKTVQ